MKEHRESGSSRRSSDRRNQHRRSDHRRRQNKPVDNDQRIVEVDQRKLYQRTENRRTGTDRRD